ncbi:alpha/beta hydrolase [Antrihabitans stalactiti]|uniref:Alpha/beta hydrolase n=1 Tax=Antrihabitans stalactiti TaxID=2584121 RepID=A0A848KDC2_9NOCA|nr:alpha/beta hydrolase [Antrihabitans stalactiti]NMN94027.1 alpha/beta hydrolase [Antrihabitans stalactiti]
MRWTTLAAVVGTVAMLCSACGAGPSDRPVVAVKQGVGGDNPNPTTTKPADQAPALETPKGDLEWRDCKALLNLYGLGPGPDGLVLQCAEFNAPVESNGSVYGSVAIGVLRAKLANTPADAPPLVLTSGSDRPSTMTLTALASGQGNAILSARPIVAIDRRGIGDSMAIDCMKAETRRGLNDLGQFTTANGQDAVDTVSALSQDATIACKDYLQPQEMAFDTGHGADDLEQLRKVWEVNTLAIMGTGNGAKVALAYAQKHPKNVSRLILDSPEGFGLDATTLTEQRLQGAEAAITGFAGRCTGIKCSLGADPRQAIINLVEKARAGQLGSISSNALVTAISGFLGSPRADQGTRVAELSDALSAADRGDYTALNGLIMRAEAQTNSDGQFVNRCSDGQQWPTPAKVRELQTEWGKKYPIFGRDGATGMLACSAWPVASPQKAPTDLKLPVLVLSSDADPITGNGGLASVTGALNSGGARVAAISWRGWGHPASAHSGCVQQAVAAYIESGKLPKNGTVCPA